VDTLLLLNHTELMHDLFFLFAELALEFLIRLLHWYRHRQYTLPDFLPLLEVKRRKLPLHISNGGILLGQKGMHCSTVPFLYQKPHSLHTRFERVESLS
jgi:hypothetical protein